MHLQSHMCVCVYVGYSQWDEILHCRVDCDFRIESSRRFQWNNKRNLMYTVQWNTMYMFHSFLFYSLFLLFFSISLRFASILKHFYIYWIHTISHTHIRTHAHKQVYVRVCSRNRDYTIRSNLLDDWTEINWINYVNARFFIAFQSKFGEKFSISNF